MQLRCTSCNPALPQAKYGVDEVHWLSDMAAVLSATQPPCLHVLKGTNTDRSGTGCMGCKQLVVLGYGACAA